MYNTYGEMNPLDEIRIDNLRVFGRHGVYQEEREKGQDFYINARLYADLRRAGREDDLTKTVNYAEVCEFLDRRMQSRVWNLIEAAAEQLAAELLQRFPIVNAVKLEIRKPNAPVTQPFESISVCITRGWHRVYLSVGSNKGLSDAIIMHGVNSLGRSQSIRNIRSSALITTKPYGGVEQEDFRNGAVELETLLTPPELLELLHEIEEAAGRNRKEEQRWGPRTLDMDILFYDQICYEDRELTIPHCDLANRYFVLAPMLELAPNLIHPVLHKSIRQLYEELPPEARA